jgi:beta-glucosidase
VKLRLQESSFQGTDLAATNTILACAKHFAGWLCRIRKDLIQLMWVKLPQNTIFPPFKAAVDAGENFIIPSMN